ncbi:hypothetical protein [Amorphus sp. 3PC139-8]|uniref:hypothetical protein n=1 Tax=Amorphus sp. 3PC139-8 TaxID=2735676 RepID=UPI00345D39C7
MTKLRFDRTGLACVSGETGRAVFVYSADLTSEANCRLLRRHIRLKNLSRCAP